jgi:beta-phosphoglucomutase
MGYPAYYPVHDVRIQKPLKAVLMDLDGTTVRSEEFWIWIIQQTTASLLDNPSFELEDADLPFVSGHSVSEHLEHCIEKYCPDKTVEEASFTLSTLIEKCRLSRMARGRKTLLYPRRE